MDRALRLFLTLAGALAALLCAGYAAQAPWALATWPWAEGRLGNLFAASILAAVAAAMLWTGATGRLAGAAAGFLHVATMLAGIASVLLPLGLARMEPVMSAYALGFALAAGGALAAFAYVRRLRVADGRALPASLRAWCVLYLLILLPAGTALLLRAPGIMPWPVKPEASMVYGWVFLAAMWSFAYPLARPQVEHVRVGLVGFLAYDAVLLVPFVRHFEAVRPELETSLTLYTAALAISAAVSLWYLFVSPATRLQRG